MQLSTLPISYGLRDRSIVDRRLKLGCFVSEKYRLVYVDTPKAACTTVKWMLAELDGKTVDLEAAGDESQLDLAIHYRHINPLPSPYDFSEEVAKEMMTGEGYRRFCLVRNPYERIVSAWADKIRLVEPGFDKLCTRLAGGGSKSGPDDVSFATFVEWVLKTNDPSICDGHWRRQVDLVYPDIIPFQHVLRVESFEEDLQKMFDGSPLTQGLDAKSLLGSRRYNASLPIGSAPLLSQDIACQLSRFYDPDFTVFSYDRDSWRSLTNCSSVSFSQLEQAALRAIRARNRVIERMAATIEELRMKT